MFLALSDFVAACSQVEFNVTITDKNDGQKYENKETRCHRPVLPFTPQHYVLTLSSKYSWTREQLNLTDESWSRWMLRLDGRKMRQVWQKLSSIFRMKCPKMTPAQRIRAGLCSQRTTSYDLLPDHVRRHWMNVCRFQKVAEMQTRPPKSDVFQSFSTIWKSLLIKHTDLLSSFDLGNNVTFSSDTTLKPKCLCSFPTGS